MLSRANRPKFMAIPNRMSVRKSSVVDPERVGVALKPLQTQADRLEFREFWKSEVALAHPL